MKMEINDVWTTYKATGERKYRDQLILNYDQLLRYVASKMANGLPSSVEEDDLVSYGLFGLIDAIEKFEPERGFKFETYAVSRIRGSIYDELRAMDWVPRSVRARVREMQTTISDLEGDFGRRPTDSEVAYAMGITVEKLADLQFHLSSPMVSLDEAVPGMDETVTLAETITDGSDMTQVSELSDYLGDTINQAEDALAEKERLVLTLYYYEGLTLADIGKVLGVTESRICQIHTKAVLNLRSLI